MNKKIYLPCSRLKNNLWRYIDPVIKLRARERDFPDWEMDIWLKTIIRTHMSMIVRKKVIGYSISYLFPSEGYILNHSISSIPSISILNIKKTATDSNWLIYFIHFVAEVSEKKFSSLNQYVKSVTKYIHSRWEQIAPIWIYMISQSLCIVYWVEVYIKIETKYIPDWKIAPIWFDI